MMPSWFDMLRTPGGAETPPLRRPRLAFWALYDGSGSAVLYARPPMRAIGRAASCLAATLSAATALARVFDLSGKHRVDTVFLELEETGG